MLKNVIALQTPLRHLRSEFIAQAEALRDLKDPLLLRRGIHEFSWVGSKEDADGRDKPGHDDFSRICLSRVGLGWLSHGPVAHDAMIGVAVRIRRASENS